MLLKPLSIATAIPGCLSEVSLGYLQWCICLVPYHVTLERFLSVLTKTVEDAEYQDLIVHGLTCHPLV